MKPASLHATPLAYFLEVAQRGSLSAASQTLHVAVSAISRQIARLESDMGTPLFHRDPRGMRLTEAGLAVQHYARRTLLDAQALQDALHGLASLAHTAVRLACTDGFAHDYMPSVIARFQQSYPGVTFSMINCEPAQVTRHVREGIVDLGLTFATAAQEGIRVEHSEVAPVYAHVSRHHPLARLKSVTLREVLRHPLVLPTPPNTIRQLFDLVCSLEDLRPQVLMTSNSISGLAAYLRHGSAVNLIGSLAVRNRQRPDRQVLVPISNPEMSQRVLQVQSMAGRQLSAGVRAFCDALLADIRRRRPRVPKLAGSPLRER